MTTGHVLLIGSLLLASACSRTPGSSGSTIPPALYGGAPAGAARPGTSSGDSSRADGARALGEFETLTAADVQLYLKVMRGAAERVKTMSKADRAALDLLHGMTTHEGGAQLPSAEQLAAIERAGDLLALDAVVARGMGVATRYGSIASRVPKFGWGEMSGEGDNDAPPMTAEQKAALRARIEKFRERRRLDMAAFEPYRQEIEALQRQVDLITHPQSVPKQP